MQKVILGLLILALLAVSAIAFLFWQRLKSFEPNVYYYVPPQKSFIYTEEELKYGIEKYLREAVEKEWVKLINEKKNFIYADLKKMELSLYKGGEKFKVFPIKSKGAEWFWGETPPGVYSAGYKIRLHSSSKTGVWMPYAIQYYGNYFIHGWPYDKEGRLLEPGPSGGCIRLQTEDAAVVFEFVQMGTPILIFDEKIIEFLPALRARDKEISPLKINSQAFLVADLDTGEIILNQEADSQIHAGPAATYGMLALASSDSVNLERTIIAKDWMITGIGEKIIVAGKSYKGYDLLKPLLSFSSKEAALVLSRFLNPEKFVALMNDKAKGIGMKNTSFADVTGTSKENITTLYDVAKMFRYIKDYRKFIFDINQEWHGLAENESETIFAYLKAETSDNVIRSIFIGLTGSQSSKEDLKNILLWLESNFDLKLKKGLK